MIRQSAVRRLRRVFSLAAPTAVVILITPLFWFFTQQTAQSQSPTPRQPAGPSSMGAPGQPPGGMRPGGVASGQPPGVLRTPTPMGQQPMGAPPGTVQPPGMQRTPTPSGQVPTAVPPGMGPGASTPTGPAVGGRRSSSDSQASMLLPRLPGGPNTAANAADRVVGPGMAARPDAPITTGPGMGPGASAATGPRQGMVGSPSNPGPGIVRPGMAPGAPLVPFGPPREAAGVRPVRPGDPSIARQPGMTQTGPGMFGPPIGKRQGKEGRVVDPSTAR